MRYSELTRRYFEQARRRRRAGRGPDCFRGAAGSRAQGTWVQFDVQIEPGGRPAGPRSAAARFLAFGCPHVIAVCFLAGRTGGRARDLGAIAARAFSRCASASRCRSPKLGRLLIVEDAWIAAMRAAQAAARPQRSVDDRPLRATSCENYD